MPLWTNACIGLGQWGVDQATALATDGKGRVIVTGRSFTGSTYVYLTIAYAEAGVPLWTNWFGGPGGDSEAAGVAVDGNQNVFITGFSNQNSNYPYGSDLTTIAYSSAGVALWTNQSGLSNSDWEAYAIGADGNDNVVVAGIGFAEVVGQGLIGQYVLIKYSNVGKPLWTNWYSAQLQAAEARALAVSSNGDVYVTGFFSGGNPFSCATIKYASAGVPLWTNFYSAPANAVVLADNGNIVVAGQSASAGQNPVYFTVGYSTFILVQGTWIFTQRLLHPITWTTCT